MQPNDELEVNKIGKAPHLDGALLVCDQKNPIRGLILVADQKNPIRGLILVRDQKNPVQGSYFGRGFKS